MEKSITPNQIKQNNRSLIYHFIYKNRKVSQQDISYALHLSRPTVTANLSAMEEEGLICKNGQIDTEFVGRKASAYSIVADYRIAVGIEILKKESTINKSENILLIKSVQACLKGLKEQGCNGPVTEAVNKIEKHINQQAHD